jgi:hypothetical protein
MRTMTSHRDSSSLIEGWRRAARREPPHLFPGDEHLLDPECSREVVFYDSFEAFVASPDFDLRSRRELHLGLMPMPFFGDLKKARIFLLLSNPGLQPVDYFAESHRPEWRQRLLENLRQENGAHSYPFAFLDPQFSWHAGFTWWESKLHELAAAIQHRDGGLYQDALRVLSTEVAALELVPYHSTTFGYVTSIHGRLASTVAVKRYVHDVILPRAVVGEAVLVVTRGNRFWGVPDVGNQRRVVIYQGGETRGASLSLESRGGRAMADLLGVLNRRSTDRVTPES